MPMMVYISKVNTKVRNKDGSYRPVVRGEEFPEAETFKNPTHWARLVNAESPEGKRGAMLREESLKRHKEPFLSSSDNSGEDENALASFEQKNVDESNENEGQESEIEATEGSESEGEESLEAETLPKDKDPLEGLDAEGIKALVLKKFGVKLHHNAGVEKCKKAYWKLVKDHKTGEA